ncbi:MAG TPA: glycosyl hydrolase-related protein, partial [Acidimicrobiales bacterium]|nr:glycosyl hydrolase-related protein [Acidimicrobiales bacterium]
IGVAATVFKRSEDGDGWVVRLVETNGRRGHARVVLRSLGREWEGSVRAHEVKTLFIPDPPGKAVSEIPLTELEDRGPQR